MSATLFSTPEINSLEKCIDNVGEIFETPKEDIIKQYEILKCADWISSNSFRKVCLQFPDKLLNDSPNVALCLERYVEASIFILGDTSYGSCCVDEVAAEHIQADSIIHFGHACLTTCERLPVLYIFEKIKGDVPKLITDFKLTFTDHDEHIALFYDTSFHHIIHLVIENLKHSYPNLVASELSLNGEAHILGRNIPGNKCIAGHVGFYIGFDNQTFFNVAMSFNLHKWFLYDPTLNVMPKEIAPLDAKWLRRRMFLVEKCKDAKILGLVVGTLTSKKYLDIIDYLQKLSRSWGKKCYIISVGKPNPAKLANFQEIDLFILVGCPENTLYESREFYKPLLTVFEADVALNPSRTKRNETSNISGAPLYSVEFQTLLPGGIHYCEFDRSDIKQHDISLITGQVRNVEMINEETKSSTDNSIDVRGGREIALGSNALENRTWRGLEQKLGQDEPQLAVLGRSGIPTSYQTEPTP